MSQPDSDSMVQVVLKCLQYCLLWAEAVYAEGF